MRGHGEAITSLSTNPIWPYLVLSTSRDHTSRVWDLSERPTSAPFNPIWPGLPPPTLAGAPHGLQASEPEGDGDGAGACVALLMGGRAGGHEATVTAAAWHPKGLPVVATCGVGSTSFPVTHTIDGLKVDRRVKIWRIPDLEPDATILVTTDKPIFSSSNLHQGRVLSVTW
jgi:WD40 repeat protein